MLELSIRPSDHEHEHQDEHARSRACFHWIINGNLFLRLLKGVVRVRYGLRKIRACLTVSNLMVKRDDASYGIRATRTVDNATRPTSGLRRSGVAVRGGMEVYVRHVRYMLHVLV
jgi:hypothetical protein